MMICDYCKGFVEVKRVTIDLGMPSIKHEMDMCLECRKVIVKAIDAAASSLVKEPEKYGQPEPLSFDEKRS